MGKNSRVCRVVKATTVPMDRAPDPEASDSPANQ